MTHEITHHMRRREAAPTRECIDINDSMLACLVVDYHIYTKQGHTQSLPQ